MRYLNARNTAFGEDRKVYSTVDSTASAGQTVFNVSYDQGRVAVFLNGIRLVPVQDYTYTLSGLGTNITLGAGITANDYLELIGLQGINAGNAVTEDNFVVGTSSTGSGGGYTNSTTVFPVSSSAGDLVSVWRNGIKLVPTTDFTVNATANTVTLQSASNTADEITVHVVGILQHSNFVQSTGGTFTGNVGIGASPAQTLHVKTSTSATPITFGVLSNATGLPAISLNGAYASTTMAGIYGNGATASNLYYTVPSGKDHIFSIADVAKMVIDDSGNVGIKQTGPASLLTIGSVNDNNSANTPLGKVGQDPAILINNSSHVNSESQLLFGYNSGSETYAPVVISYKNTSSASKGKGDLLFATRDATTDSVPSERMRITSAGDVGIGKTSYNSITTDGIWHEVDDFSHISNTSTNSTLYLNQNGSGPILDVRKAGTTKLLIDNSGNLDIGSGSVSVKKTANTSGNHPAVELHSSGTGDTGAAIAIQQQTSEGDTIIFADYDPYVEWGISAENNANEIHFTAGNSTSSLGTKTFKNNAGSDRTAYKKVIVNLSSGDVKVGGRLTAAKQPAFRAFTSPDFTSNGLMTGTNWSTSTSNGYGFDNNNDFSQGTFTAPVDGVYIATVMWDANGVTSTINLMKNGTVSIVAYEPTGLSSGGWETHSYSSTVKLYANDTLVLKAGSASGTHPFHMPGTWGHFSVTLLC